MYLNRRVFERKRKKNVPLSLHIFRVDPFQIGPGLQGKLQKLSLL